MANFYANYPSSPAGSNASVGANGAPIPTSSTLIAGEDPSLNLKPLQTDSSGNLFVNIAAGIANPLPVTDAATHTGLTTINTTLGSPFQAGGSIGNTSFIATQTTGSNLHVQVDASALPAGAATAGNQATEIASLSSIDGKMNSLGQKAMAASMPVAIASDQTALPITGSGNFTVVQPTGTNLHAVIDNFPATQPVSGTVAATQSGSWTVTANAGTNLNTSSLALESSQLTGNTSLASIDGKLPATLGQKVSASSLAVVIASDQSVIGTKAPVNTTGSGSAAAATVSTVTTLTAPANAVGFNLMNLDVSTANIRWAVGRTASATLGQQLQPGRDTGFMPCGANISLCAESGTQTYDVQWFSQ